VSVVGVDPSLSSTGLAVLAGGVLRVQRVRSKPSGADLRAQVVRLRAMVRQVAEWVDVEGPELIVMEAPAYGISENQAHFSAGYWWRLASSLLAVAPVATAAPGTLKVFATGSGRATKDEVLLAAERAFPGAGIAGNDEADAAVLAALGATWMNEPAGRFPGKGLRAVNSVHWPEVKSREEVGS